MSLMVRLVSVFSGLTLLSQVASAAVLPPHILNAAEFIPAGPVELHGTSQVDSTEWQRLPYRKADGKILLPLIRIESYGESKFSFRIQAPHRGFPEQIFLAVEGPFSTAEEADTKKLGTGEIVFSQNCTKSEPKCELNLAKVGVYRIYVVPRSIWENAEKPAEGLESGSQLLSRLLTTCSANCHRPTMNWEQFGAYLRSKKLNPNVWMDLPTKLAARWKLNPEETEKARQLLFKAIEHVKADIADRKPSRFPIFAPPSQLGKLQELLKAADVVKPLPMHTIQGKLDDLLASAPADRGRNATPPIAELPELTYGHYIDNKMSAQELKHSEAVADILSALSEPKRATNSYVDVTLNGEAKRIKTPLQFIKYLLDTGHTIEVRDERTYANFFAVKIGKDTDSLFPPWLDSGLQLNGEKVVAPMGHSQHAWRIWGPKVTARVAFFLGISGTGYFAATDSRPLWTGMRSLRTIASYDAGSEEYLFGSIMFSNYYLERNRKERDKLPEDGYALVGVCNDANAVVSYGASLGKYPVSVYPLLRMADEKLPISLPNDLLTEVLKRIPRDTELDLSGGVEGENGLDVIRRLYLMNPHDLESPWFPDAAMKSQTQAIDAYLKKKGVLK